MTNTAYLYAKHPKLSCLLLSSVLCAAQAVMPQRSDGQVKPPDAKSRPSVPAVHPAAPVRPAPSVRPTTPPGVRPTAPVAGQRPAGPPVQRPLPPPGASAPSTTQGRGPIGAPRTGPPMQRPVTPVTSSTPGREPMGAPHPGAPIGGAAGGGPRTSVNHAPAAPRVERLSNGSMRENRADGSRVERQGGSVRGFQSADGHMQARFAGNRRPEMVRVDRGGGIVQTTNRVPGGGRRVETVRPAPGGGVVRVVGYGPNHGSVERPIYGRPGYVRRSYLAGGRPYAVVYRSYHYRNYEYYRPVPAYIYHPAFYAWAGRPWGAPIAYGWGWRSEPWYGVYGNTFSPYQTYGSLDLWMTDYIIATNLRQTYEANQAAQANFVGGAPPMDGGGAPPPPETSADSAPPQITPEMKSQIAAQVKLEIEEQQQAAAAGVAGFTAAAPSGTAKAAPNDMPDALKPGHTLFRVVAPISVQANGQSCNLNPDDYIARTGDLNAEGKVNVEVQASRSTDCLRGAQTQVALNDLMTMDSDQQQHVMDGLEMASKNMGKNGLPPGPPPGTIPVPAGQAAADQGLADTLRQQQSDANKDETEAVTQVGTGS